MLALNLNSFMGGVADIWETPSLAVEGGSSEQFVAQKYDDGLLEFVSWKNEMQLALQIVVNNAYRVSQGSGTFKIEFK